MPFPFIAPFKEEIKKKLKEAGFSNVKVTYKDFLLPGVPDFAIELAV